MPPRVDHDERRRALLSDSFAIFARDGYAACTMRGLAQSLGVSTGTLYHYFSGKEAVFEAMYRQLNAEIIAAAKTEMDSATEQDARLQALLAFLANHLEQLQAVVRIGLEYHRHNPDPESRAWLSGIISTYVETFETQLHLSQPSDARIILSLLMGGLVHQLFDPDAVDLAAHIHWIERMGQRGGA